MLVAGGVYLIGAPHHAFTNGHIHGWLFLTIGILQLVWAAVVTIGALRRPGRSPLPWGARKFTTGAALSGGVLVLFLLTRVHAPYTVTMTLDDTVLAAAGRAGELAAFGALLLTLPVGARRRAAAALSRFAPSWNLGVAAAVIAGAGVWGVGAATEPLFPEDHSLHNMAAMNAPAAADESGSVPAAADESGSVPARPTMDHAGHGAGAGGAGARDAGANSGSATPRPTMDHAAHSAGAHRAGAGETAGAPGPASAYFTLTNTGTADDVLIGIAVEGAQAAAETELAATLHETQIDASGVAQMRSLDRVLVPAGETVAFAPIGRHVMIEGLGRPLAPGAALVLRFESGTVLTVPLAFFAAPPTETGFSTVSEGALTAADAWAYAG
jgi:copper(I)-binding protein